MCHYFWLSVAIIFEVILLNTQILGSPHQMQYELVKYLFYLFLHKTLCFRVAIRSLFPCTQRKQLKVFVDSPVTNGEGLRFWRISTRATVRVAYAVFSVKLIVRRQWVRISNRMAKFDIDTFKPLFIHIFFFTQPRAKWLLE